MSPIPIALNIRSGRIPVKWSVVTLPVHEVRDVDGTVLQEPGTERVFLPQVVKKAGMVELADIDVNKGEADLRTQLFKAINTNWTEEAALRFLNRVGAWQIVEDNSPRHEWPKNRTRDGMYFSATYRHRRIKTSRVVPTTLADLKSDAEFWYKRLGALRSPTRLRANLRQPPQSSVRPSERDAFAWEAQDTNTLRVSLEWEGKDPYAVIETITGWELMVANAWADVVGKADPQVCATCATRFTHTRKKKHCEWECGHLAAVRTYKRKVALEKRRSKARR